MSEFQHKPNSGSLFKNDKKETQNHPDYKGSALIDGVEYWINSWINESKTGNKYMGLSLQKKDEAHNQGVQNASNAAQPPVDDFDDDIPF